MPGKPALVPAGPARNTRESVVGHFCGRESNCQILCRSLELLVWCFQKKEDVETSFFGFFFGVNGSVHTNNLAPEKSRVICATDNECPQELKTVRFNLEPKRCKSVSLSAKRSVLRERVLFIGTQFSILYTSMYSPAEADPSWPRARSSNGETAFSV